MKRITLGRQMNRALRDASRGMTLIEVLIALALMGMIAITVLGALSTACLALFTADKRVTAESLARSQMEYVKNQGYKNADKGETYDEVEPPPGYSICSVNRTDDEVDSVVGIPWDSQNNEPADEDEGLQKIKLVIKHDDKEVFTLEGFKRRRGG